MLSPLSPGLVGLEPGGTFRVLRLLTRGATDGQAQASWAAERAAL